MNIAYVLVQSAIGISIDSMCFTCVTGDYSSLGIKPIFKTKAQVEASK